MYSDITNPPPKKKHTHTKYQHKQSMQEIDVNINQYANWKTAHMCMHITEHNSCMQYIQHRTIPIIFLFNLRTIIIARMSSVAGEM